MSKVPRAEDTASRFRLERLRWVLLTIGTKTGRVLGRNQVSAGQETAGRIYHNKFRADRSTCTNAEAVQQQRRSQKGRRQH